MLESCCGEIKGGLVVVEEKYNIFGFNKLRDKLLLTQVVLGGWRFVSGIDKLGVI